MNKSKRHSYKKNTQYIMIHWGVKVLLIFVDASMNFVWEFKFKRAFDIWKFAWEVNKITRTSQAKSFCPCKLCCRHIKYLPYFVHLDDVDIKVTFTYQKRRAFWNVWSLKLRNYDMYTNALCNASNHKTQLLNAFSS